MLPVNDDARETVARNRQRERDTMSRETLARRERELSLGRLSDKRNTVNFRPDKGPFSLSVLPIFSQFRASSCAPIAARRSLLKTKCTRTCEFACGGRGGSREQSSSLIPAKCPYVSASPHRRHSGRQNGVNSLSLIHARGCRFVLLSHVENLHLTSGLHNWRQNGEINVPDRD